MGGKEWTTKDMSARNAVNGLYISLLIFLFILLYPFDFELLCYNIFVYFLYIFVSSIYLYIMKKYLYSRLVQVKVYIYILYYHTDYQITRITHFQK